MRPGREEARARAWELRHKIREAGGGEPHVTSLMEMAEFSTNGVFYMSNRHLARLMQRSHGSAWKLIDWHRDHGTIREIWKGRGKGKDARGSVFSFPPSIPPVLTALTPGSDGRAGE